MKSLRTIMMCGALLLAPMALAQETPPEPVDDYAYRVAVFANSEAGDLAGWRRTADAVIAGKPEPTRRRDAEFYNLLERCERLLGELRIAPEIEFGWRRDAYTQAKLDLLNTAHVAQLIDDSAHHVAE